MATGEATENICHQKVHLFLRCHQRSSYSLLLRLLWVVKILEIDIRSWYGVSHYFR